MKNSYRSIKLLGAPLLVAIAISLVWGGVAYAGGRSSRVENAVNSLDDRNTDIMPVPASSGAGAANNNSLLSDADAINSKIYDMNRDAMAASQGIAYSAQNNRLTLHEPGKGGPTSSGGAPVKADGQATTIITYVDQGSIDRANATQGAPLTWSPNRGKTVYRYETLIIGGKRYILAGFGYTGTAPQSMEVIQGAMKIARDKDTILVRGGQYGYDNGTASSYFQFRSNVSLYGGYKEDGTRDIVNNSTVFNGDVAMADIHDSTLDGVTITAKHSDQSLYTDRGYNLTIRNNIIINNYDVKTGWYAGTKYTWYAHANAIKFHNNNSGGTILLQNNTIISSEFAFWNHGWGNSTTVIFKDNIVSAPKNYNDVTGGFLSTQTKDTGGPKGVAPVKEKSEVTTAAPTSKNTPILPAAADGKTIGTYKLFGQNTGKTYDTAKIISIFRKMLNEKDNLAKAAAGAPNAGISPNDMAMPTEGARSALAVPADNAGGQHRARGLDVELLMADMMLNPTEEGERILSAVRSIQNEVTAARDRDMPGDEDLKKAADNFIDIAGVVMAAEATILKKEDIAVINDAFSEFNKLKGNIIGTYQSASEEYYDDLKNVIEKNYGVLTMNGILTKELLENGLANLSRQDMCNLLKKMKSSQDSSIEVQRIIEKDAELRAMHKMDKKDGEFVKEMTGLLTRFTTKFYNVLNERGALQAGRQAKEKPIVNAGLAMK